ALLVHIGETPLAEFLHGPFAGLLNRRRSGEPRTVDVAQPRNVVHHLRAVHALGADAPDGRVVELFRLRAGERDSGGDRNQRECKAFHSPYFFKLAPVSVPTAPSVVCAAFRPRRKSLSEYVVKTSVG